MNATCTCGSTSTEAEQAALCTTLVTNAEEELRSDILVFQETHRALRDGNAKYAATNSEADALFVSIQPSFEALLQIGTSTLQHEDSLGGNIASLEQLQLAESTYVSGMDRIVSEFEHDSNQRARLVLVLGWGAVVATVAVVIVEMLVVARPTLHRLGSLVLDVQQKTAIVQRKSARLLAQRELMAFLVHEVKNPLAGVLAMLEFLLDECVTLQERARAQGRAVPSSLLRSAPSGGRPAEQAPAPVVQLPLSGLDGIEGLLPSSPFAIVSAPPLLPPSFPRMMGHPEQIGGGRCAGTTSSSAQAHSQAASTTSVPVGDQGHRKFVSAAIESAECMRADLRAALRLSEHMQQILANLLDFSKLQAGQLELSAHRVDIAEDVLIPACTTLRHSLHSRTVLLVDAGDPPLVILADKQRLLQMTINFIGNAVRHCKSGFILVRARHTAAPVAAVTTTTTATITTTGAASVPVSCPVSPSRRINKDRSEAASRWRSSMSDDDPEPRAGVNTMYDLRQAAWSHVELNATGMGSRAAGKVADPDGPDACDLEAASSFSLAPPSPAPMPPLPVPDDHGPTTGRTAVQPRPLAMRRGGQLGTQLPIPSPRRSMLGQGRRVAHPLPRDARLASGDAQSTSSRSMLLLEVCDTGPGIPEDQQTKLFSKFVRLGTHSGSGLGLALNKTLAELMGGTVGVVSPWPSEKRPPPLTAQVAGQVQRATGAGLHPSVAEPWPQAAANAAGAIRSETGDIKSSDGDDRDAVGSPRSAIVHADLRSVCGKGCYFFATLPLRDAPGSAESNRLSEPGKRVFALLPNLLRNQHASSPTSDTATTSTGESVLGTSTRSSGAPDAQLAFDNVRAPAAETMRELQGSSIPAGKAATPRSYDGEGRVRILIVDDVSVNRQIIARRMKSVFGSVPVEVTMAATGEEAVALIEAQGWRLGDLHGLQTCGYSSAGSDTESTPCELAEFSAPRDRTGQSPPFDLVIMDEYMSSVGGKLLGSTVLRALRRLDYPAVQVHCSANNALRPNVEGVRAAAEAVVTSEVVGLGESAAKGVADVLWGKPFPGILAMRGDLSRYFSCLGSAERADGVM